jgi:hypothetical protein
VALRRVAELERQLAEAQETLGFRESRLLILEPLADRIADMDRQLAEARAVLRQAASMIAMLASARPMVEWMSAHQVGVVERMLERAEALTQKGPTDDE